MKNRLKSAALGLLALGSFHLAHAQDATISGKVVDQSNDEELIGVTILVQGTSTGTTTDFSGNYTLAAAPADTLVFSYIGYRSQKVAVGNRTTIDVSLEPALQELTEVVVTALGIERDKKALGYSVQQVSADQFAVARENNVVNSLSGRVSGVQITRSGTGQGGSSQLLIRGVSSLTGNNRPLVVIDGVPVNNSAGGTGDQFGGIDYGDALANLNPDDIESFSVLKGASAAALYGSRGQNGVLLITTRSGKSRKGLGVEYNFNVTAEGLLVQPELQNQFGRGDALTSNVSGGSFNYIQTNSWGAELDGTEQLIWTGATAPYSPQPDNYRDFWETGYTVTNSIAVSGGSEDTQVRGSFAHRYNDGIMPNSSLEQYNFTVRLTSKLSEVFSFDSKVNYIRNEAFNRPNLVLSPDNPVKNLLEMPRNTRLADLQDYQTVEGFPRTYRFEPGTSTGDASTFQNPYWAVNNSVNEDRRDRLIGYMKLDFEITPWLTGFVRSGIDIYWDERERRLADQTIYRQDKRAFLSLTDFRFQEVNTDFYLTASKQWNDTWFSSLSVGGNVLQNEITSSSIGGSLIIADYYQPINIAVPVNPTPSESRFVTQSLYARGEVSYKNLVFLEVTGRNDWTSVLSPDNWSFFYPSASMSAVVSDMTPLPEAISFLKARVSYAGVGNAVTPHSLDNLFAQNALNHGGQPFAQIVGTNRNPDLRSEFTNSYEVGLESRFLLDRARFDVTLYQASTVDQIQNVEVSRASGFSTTTTNAGEVRNRGIELLLGGTALKNWNGLTWDINLNWTLNRNDIVELAPGVENITTSFNQYGISVINEVGQPLGNIYANNRYVRRESGNIAVTEEGVPIKENELELIGNFQPAWFGGLENNFAWKGFSLRTLLDARWGGQVFSYTQAAMAFQGISEVTADQRLAFDGGFGGIVVAGEQPDGDINTREISPQQYWQQVGGLSGAQVAEEFIYDASYVKLREVSLSYRLPKELSQRIGMQATTLSFVARNLAILYSQVPGFDPETSFTSNSRLQGIEVYSFPSTRSIGFNLNARF